MANKVELQERNGPWAHVSFVLGSHAPEASRPKQIKNMAPLLYSTVLFLCMKRQGYFSICGSKGSIFCNAVK